MAPHYPPDFIVCGMFSFEFFPRIRVGNFIWKCIKKCERSHYQWLYSSKLLLSESYPPSVMPLRTSALASNLRSGSCDGLGRWPREEQNVLEGGRRLLEGPGKGFRSRS